jgi:peptidoglycan-associated lipoprotein
MRKWTTTKVTVEGHCDSRGSAEYNLALGDRRASAVKAYLSGLGVGAERIMTLSKGKEAPFCTDEKSRAGHRTARPLSIITAK